jgi:hypothetical protein
VRYAFHLGALLRHAGFDRRLIILVLDSVEGRRVKRQRTLPIEGVPRTEVSTGAGANRTCGQRDRSGNYRGVEIVHCSSSCLRTMGCE